MRIHLRSTTSGGTLAVRFRDTQIGKESTTASSCEAVVNILGISLPAVVLCHTRATALLWELIEARAVVVVSLKSYASRQHSATIVKYCDARNSARWMDCRDEEHERRALTSRAGHERACMRIVE